MPKELLPNELWELVAPLIPPIPPRPMGGRPPISSRACLRGIIFVLRTGIPWEYLPEEMGCSGMSCWRRLRDWQQSGVWDAIHRALLDRLGGAGEIDWTRASLDGSSIAAVKRGSRRDRIRPIAASRVRSTISLSTGKVRRSRR